VRSKEVLAARERGELPEKEKKVLKKDAVMKKTREGTKDGAKGRPVPSKGKPFVKGAQVGKGPKKGEDRDRVGKDSKKEGKKADDTSNFKPGFPPGEEGRLARRAQIIQKKRMMRRNRKGGSA